MSEVYLNCSGLPSSIHLNSDLPNSIYVDGNNFLNRLEQILVDQQNNRSNRITRLEDTESIRLWLDEQINIAIRAKTDTSGFGETFDYWKGREEALTQTLEKIIKV